MRQNRLEGPLDSLLGGGRSLRAALLGALAVLALLVQGPRVL